MNSNADMSPLGVIDSLSAGFGAVTQKPSLLLLPLLLDLFLWLGPRLSTASIVPELVARLGTSGGADSSAELFRQNLVEIFGSFNLFSALSTWPLGVPSLLAGNDPGSGPLKSPATIQVQGLNAFLIWLILLTLSGLFLGSLYMAQISQWSTGKRWGLGPWTKLVWLHWIRIVTLVLAVMAGAFVLSVSLFLAVEVVALIFAPLAPLLLLAGIWMGMWGLFHLFFVVHGMLIDDLPLPDAVRSSVGLVRRYPFSSVGLLTVAVVISLGLSTIWNMPASDSWMRLIAIVGNAFVNTGLAVATVVYYCERVSSVQFAPLGEEQTFNN